MIKNKTKLSVIVNKFKSLDKKFTVSSKELCKSINKATKSFKKLDAIASLKQADLAYFAGILEGEGSLFCDQNAH